jgi:hypothetical protein
VSIQGIIIILGSAALLASSVVLVRLRLLSIRYGLGWIAVSLMGMAGAPVLDVLSGQVEDLGFTATGFSLGVVILFLGLVCLQLSISLSGVHHSVQDLTEHAALVEQRLRELEDRHADTERHVA